MQDIYYAIITTLHPYDIIKCMSVCKSFLKIALTHLSHNELIMIPFLRQINVESMRYVDNIYGERIVDIISGNSEIYHRNKYIGRSIYFDIYMNSNTLKLLSPENAINFNTIVGNAFYCMEFSIVTHVRGFRKISPPYSMNVFNAIEIRLESKSNDIRKNINGNGESLPFDTVHKNIINIYHTQIKKELNDHVNYFVERNIKTLLPLNFNMDNILVLGSNKNGLINVDPENSVHKVILTKTNVIIWETDDYKWDNLPNNMKPGYNSRFIDIMRLSIISKTIYKFSSLLGIKFFDKYIEKKFVY